MSINQDQQLNWHQGLFLQPQHFQHNDRLNARQLALFSEMTQPYCWGLTSIQINESALSAGQFSVSQLSIRFTDGHYVQFPGNALVESRSLGQLRTGARTVYLGIRRIVEGHANVSIFDNADIATRATTRYASLAEPQLIPDLLTGEGEASVRAMYYVARVFWDDELSQFGQYDCLPIARLEHDGDVTRLAAHYVPPIINLQASPALQQMLRDIRDDVAGRARQLEVYKPAADTAHAEVPDASHFRLLHALSTLNRYGPLLAHLLETPQVHPWTVYGVLRQFIGELSWFSKRCDMFGQTPEGKNLVQSYRHDEIGIHIESMRFLIAQLLNEITLGPEQLVRFVQAAEDINKSQWVADLPASFFGSRHRYYLVARGGDTALLGKRLPTEAKLCASSKSESFITHALPGVEILSLQTPPAGMPRRADAAFFRIETISDAWNAITREHSATLFFPNAPDDFSAELIVVRK